jgi:hypothetical protein
MVYPKAGEIEHWTYIKGGGGWDHPIHSVRRNVLQRLLPD